MQYVLCAKIVVVSKNESMTTADVDVSGAGQAAFHVSESSSSDTAY